MGRVYYSTYGAVWLSASHIFPLIFFGMSELPHIYSFLSDLVIIDLFFHASVNLNLVPTNNWEPNQGAEPTIHASDWRAQLEPESRQRIVTKMYVSVDDLRVFVCVCVCFSY